MMMAYELQADIMAYLNGRLRDLEVVIDRHERSMTEFVRRAEIIGQSEVRRSAAVDKYMASNKKIGEALMLKQEVYDILSFVKSRRISRD